MSNSAVWMPAFSNSLALIRQRCKMGRVGWVRCTALGRGSQLPHSVSSLWRVGILLDLFGRWRRRLCIALAASWFLRWSARLQCPLPESTAHADLPLRFVDVWSKVLGCIGFSASAGGGLWTSSPWSPARQMGRYEAEGVDPLRRSTQLATCLGSRTERRGYGRSSKLIHSSLSWSRSLKEKTRYHIPDPPGVSPSISSPRILLPLIVLPPLQFLHLGAIRYPMSQP